MTSIYRANRKPRLWLPSWALFFGLGAIYVVLNIWLSNHGYISNFDIQRWSKAMTSIDADEFRIEHIGLLYPHGPIYLLALARGALGLDSVMTAAWLSALFMALMFGLWNRHLWHKGYPLGVRLTIVALLALHPFSLWAASSGLHNALLLFAFYFFCYGCYLIISIHDLRAVVLTAFMLAVMFFSDERASFLFVALLPLIPFLAPGRMLGNSLIGIYSILVFPLIVAAGGWIYLNWVFHGNAWEFLQAPEASFRGALSQAANSPWLATMGGQWFLPVSSGLLLAILTFPLPLWLAWRYRAYSARFAATLTLFIHPVVAIGMATSLFFLADAFSLLYLLIAVTMASLLLMPRLRQFRLLIFMLALGNTLGWLAIDWKPSHETYAWRQALMGHTLPVRDNQNQLGLWLRDNPLPALMDDRTLHYAIVVRGDAKNLYLPFTYQFKNEMKRQQPETPLIVVSNPSLPGAALDRVTQQFPALFWHGAPGYELAFDIGEWRVWRKTLNLNP